MGNNASSDQPYADLARAIINQIPRIRGGNRSAMHADQLALTILLEGADDGLPMGAIRRVLMLSLSMTSELVDRAVAAGRVARSVSASDRRVYLVSLTPAGKRERMRARWRTHG